MGGGGRGNHRIARHDTQKKVLDHFTNLHGRRWDMQKKESQLELAITSELFEPELIFLLLPPPQVSIHSPFLWIGQIELSLFHLNLNPNWHRSSPRFVKDWVCRGEDNAFPMFSWIFGSISVDFRRGFCVFMKISARNLRNSIGNNSREASDVPLIASMEKKCRNIRRTKAKSSWFENEFTWICSFKYFAWEESGLRGRSEPLASLTTFASPFSQQPFDVIIKHANKALAVLVAGLLLSHYLYDERQREAEKIYVNHQPFSSVFTLFLRMNISEGRE